MNDQLELIKKLHQEADELYKLNKYDDMEKIVDIMMRLFGNGDTDWLIEQAEKLEKLEESYFSGDFTPIKYLKVSAEVFGD